MARSYPAEFRRKVLDLLEAGRPVAGVGQQLGVTGQSSVEGVIVFWAWYSLIYATVSELAGGQFLFEALGVWRW